MAIQETADATASTKSIEQKPTQPKPSKHNATKQKPNPSAKELKLMDKIEQAKKELHQLQEKRKKDIGVLAYKHNLHLLDQQTLELAFAKLAKEHADGHD